MFNNPCGGTEEFPLLICKVHTHVGELDGIKLVSFPFLIGKVLTDLEGQAAER